MDIARIGSSSTLYAFTPLRRGGYTNNTTPLPPDAGVEWTTARCHRLLRALTSRVAILTKDLARFSAADQPENDCVRRIEEAKSPDGEWNVTKKKVKQTYGRRGIHGQNGGKSRMLPPNKTRTSLIPGEILVPTPILLRARREYAEEDIPSTLQHEPECHNQGRNKRRRMRYSLDDMNSGFQLSEGLRELRQKASATRFATYEGIYNGLEALLLATAPAKPKLKRKGARSLFSMALRAVPAYISQQEGLIAEHLQKTGKRSTLPARDMETEIYDELEDFGSSGHGWKHLKTVVRSHGIHVLSEAIGAGILERDFVGCLVTLCIRHSAMDEAHTLFSTVLCSIHFAPPRSVYEKPNQLLSMLWKFTEHTGSSLFQYRELLKLFSLGLLPVEWLATKDFGHVWTGVFQTLSSGSENAEALIFLDTLLPMLSSATNDDFTSGNTAISEAINNTFSSVLTTLSSIIILSDERQTLHGDSDIATLETSKNIITLLNGCSTPIRHDTETTGVLPLLSTLFTRGSIDSCDLSVLADLLGARLQEERDKDPKSYALAVLFTCSTARCCGRGALSSGFEHLQRIHQLLQTCNPSSGPNILKSLIVDSAFAFAEQIPDREHLQYAAEMDTKFCVRRIEPSSNSHSLPDDGQQRSGYRWEEGIGEWVTASPLAAKKMATIIASREHAECDTPYRPPPNLRRKIENSAPPVLRTEREPVEEAMVASPASSLDFGGCSNVEVDDGYFEEQDGLHNSGSDDELAPDSSQLDSSDESELSFNGAEMTYAGPSLASTKFSLTSTSYQCAVPRRSMERAPRRNRSLLSGSQDWTKFEDSAISIASSLDSNERSSKHRQSIDKAPRLGRKALRSNQTWQLFDDSDDELSFVSVSSVREDVLQEFTDTSINTGRLRQRAEKAPSGPYKAVNRRVVNASESEDELGI